MSKLFSSGLEVANLLVTSEPLHQSWKAIEDEKQRLNGALGPNAPPTLHFNRTRQSDFTIITFLTSPMSLRGREGWISSSNFRNENLPDFDFLCNKSNPSFRINEAAIKLFASRYNELCQLRTEISKSNSLVIITGHSMGGCVARLFTLWLLESLNLSKTKRPLCITFGSPLLGDENLRKCVSQFSTWNSCFLHVASIQDPVPKLFLSQAGAYTPLGTFLLCSASGCACFEDPGSILQLLEETNSHSAQTQNTNLGVQVFDYGPILKYLKLKVLCKDVTDFVERDISPLQAGIITQLLAIGVLPAQPQLNIDINGLIERIEGHVQNLARQRAKVSNSSKLLNEIKIEMVRMELYKKLSKEILNLGYYDRYKNQHEMADSDIVRCKKKLSNYWEDSVTEVENKPQKEGASFRTRWLMGGTTYRRMVEPLHIADYYRDNKKDYINEKTRPRHFILLEKWLKEEEDRKEAERIEKGEAPKASPSKSKVKSVASSLNDDSCFWAHVEEALILCKLPVNEQKSAPVKEKFIEFENYVLEALKNFAVTPDIFFGEGSFMVWWKKYNEVVGSSTQLARIMRDGTYLEYQNGVNVVY